MSNILNQPPDESPEVARNVDWIKLSDISNKPFFRYIFNITTT